MRLENIGSEYIFALIAFASSFFSGRLTLVFARNGVTDQNILALLTGTIANCIWMVCIYWFYLQGTWLPPLLTGVFVLFYLNMIILPDKPVIYRIRHVVRFVSISAGILMWNTHFVMY